MGGATLREVAEAAGVSIWTTSKVLNGDPGKKVSPATCQKVREVADRLGYRPNIMARGLARSRTSLIGVVVPSLMSSFIPETIQGIQDTAETLGYSMLLYTTQSRSGKEAEYLQLLVDKGVDGIIWAPDRDDNAALCRRLEKEIPMLQLYYRLSGLNSPYVIVDHTKGAYLATKHLINLGHRCIGHLSAPDHAHGLLRLQGYRDALKEAGLEPDDALVAEAGYEWEGGYAAALKLLQRPEGERPTALFASCDLSAWGAISAARSLGLQVPQDLAVVGFDDLKIAAFSPLALTTVAQPRYEIGRVAMTKLHRQIDGERVKGEVLDVELIVRTSSGATGELLLG
ncbi:MAG: LacI family DNA-binding transcriptional regulator [Chitinophagales bacterium]